jgi:hypothetical protein
VHLLTDGKKLGRFKGTVLSNQLLAVYLAKNTRVIQELRLGNRLTVRAARQDFHFRLTNSAKAISRIKSCVNLVVRAKDRHTNPFARDLNRNETSNRKTKPNPFSPSDKTKVKTVVRDFIRIVLESAGLKGFKFYTPKGKNRKRIYR